MGCLSGDNGILNKAKLAKENSDVAGIEEQNKLGKYNDYIEGYTTRSGNTSNSTSWSTDEKVVGTWRDGKTLYQKMYYFNTSFEAYSIADLNYDEIWIDWSLSNVNLQTTANNYIYAVTNFYRSSTDFCDVRLRVSAKNVLFLFGSNYKFVNANIVLNYTKLT